MINTIDDVIAALQYSWGADTAYDATEWTEENPARGNCVVSSLVINDYFKGDFQKYKVYGDVEETHYCNVLWNGVRVDSTGSQYNGLKVELQPTEANLKGYSSCREKLLADEATRERYEILKIRVHRYLNE